MQTENEMEQREEEDGLAVTKLGSSQGQYSAKKTEFGIRSQGKCGAGS